LMLECLLSILLLVSGVAAVTALYWLDLQQQHALTIRRQAMSAVSDVLEECRAHKKMPMSMTIAQGPITVLCDVRKDETLKVLFSWITVTAQWHSLSGSLCTYTACTGMVCA